ncbi:MAG: hypothetical protein U0586_16790, partial [Candidatus Brocadiaceae bacterium]
MHYLKTFGILLLLVFPPFFSTSPVNAGFITITTNTSLTVTDNSIKIKVIVTNDGDEPAYNAQIHVNENHRLQTSPVQQFLPVKECFEYEFQYDLLQTKHGRYPLLININYTDINQYPFTAATGTYYTFGSDTVSQVFGITRNISLSSHGSLPLLLKNMDDVSREITVQFVVPKELSILDKAKKITLPPRSELSFTFGLRNFSALPGSRYQAFFIIEYEDESKHYSNIVPCFITIEEPKKFFEKYMWY